MDLKKILALNAAALEKEEARVLAGEKKHVQKVSSDLISLFENFIKANKGGKKIRGFLIRLGFEMAQSVILSQKGEGSLANASFPNENDILKIAAAYEILHTSILAHDDIIDKSPKRRGIPSLYKSVGVDQAITLADYGFFLAMKIISESKFEEKLKNQALRLFSQTMIDTAIGQMLDVAHGDSEKIALLKTARYTIAGPMQIGAILGGLGPTSPRLRGVKEFGENLGIAFQIQDDILDREVESVDESKENALKYANKARKLIPKLTGNIKMRKLLEEIVDYMVERNK